MAQPIEERLKVLYTTVENCETKQVEKRLLDLTKEEKDSIVSLVILPIYNKDNSLYSRAKDISQYIENFPMLSEIGYPAQFVSIDISKIQRQGCHNFKKVNRIREIGRKEQLDSITVKGKAVTYNSDFELNGEKIVMGDKYETVEIFEFSPVDVKKQNQKSTNIKKTFVTSSDMENFMHDIDGKLGVIRQKVIAMNGNVDKIPSTAKIKRLLNGTMTGLATTEDLNNLREEIKSINVNVDIAALENSVNETLEKTLTKIHSDKTEQNKKLANIANTLAEINKQNIEDDQKSKLILDLLRKQVPSLIATNRALTDKVYTKLGAIDSELTKEGGIKDDLENIKDCRDLIFDYLGKINGEVRALKDTDEETKNLFVQSFNVYAREIIGQVQSGNQSFFDDIRQELQNKPNIEDVERIIVAQFDTLGVNFGEKIDEIKSSLGNQIIKSMGDIGKLTQKDVNNIGKMVASLLASEEFQDILKKSITENSEFGDMQKILHLVEQRLMDMPTEAQMEEMFQKYIGNAMTDEDLHKLIEDNSGKNIDSIKDMLDSARNEASIYFKRLFDNNQQHDNALNYLEKSAIQNKVDFKIVFQLIDELKKGLDESNRKNNENSTVINDMSKSVLNFINSNKNVDDSAMGLAHVVYANGINPSSTSPFVLTAIPTNSSTMTPPAVNLNEDAIVKLVAQTIKGLGGIHVADDSEMSKLKAENDDLKTKLKDSNEKIVELDKKLDDVLELLKKQKADKNKEEEKSVEETGKNDNSGKDLSREDFKKNTKENTGNNTILKNDKMLAMPERKKEVPFVKESIENMNKLKEPKLSKWKRLGKFIIRHPFRSALIGLGIGAVATAGVATVIFGGFAGVATAIDFFLPTVLTGGAVGAGTVLGGGLIGAIVSKYSKKGRKERLYAKFQKQAKSCERCRDKIQEMQAQLENVNKSIELDRQNHSKQNKFLKSIGYYNRARQFKRDKIRQLKAEIRNQESQQVVKVDEALQTKRALNDLEQLSNNSMAIGGYLNQRKKVQARYAKAMSSKALDEEDKKDLASDMQDEISDLSENAGGDISKVSDRYQTFDSEAEELINSVKDKQETEIMRTMRDDIKLRNSKEVKEKKTFKDYEAEEFNDYVDYLKTKGSTEEKQKFKESFNERNKEADELLKAGYIRKVQAENYAQLMQQIKQAQIDNKSQQTDNDDSDARKDNNPLNKEEKNVGKDL